MPQTRRGIGVILRYRDRTSILEVQMTDRNERQDPKEIEKQEREQQEPIRDLQEKRVQTDDQVKGGNYRIQPEPE